MVKTVIFDIGMVLMSFRWFDYVYGQFGKEKGDIITDAMWTYGDWNELDRGVWSHKQLLEAFCSHAPEYSEDILWTFQNVGMACHKFDYAIPWVQEMKANGFQVLFLSNYSHHIMDCAPEVLGFLPYMDGGVFSCDVHYCKPEREIYEAITKKYQLTPSECFFIDDNKDNIEAARAFGWHTHLYTDYATDYDDIMRELKELSTEE